MKKYALLTLAVGCLACQLAIQQTALADDAGPKTDQEKIGYILGYSYSQRLLGGGLEGADFDAAAFAKGLQDGFASKPSQIPSTNATALMTALQAKINARRESEEKDSAKAGVDFLAKNKNEAGVITLTNGLQYKILTAGKGPIPKPTDSVNVKYRGTFIDGRVFDPGDQPIKVNLLTGGVIPGWLDILKIMPVGSKWRVFIPSDLAYGSPGRGPIPPDTTLIFEMELLSIEP